MTVEGAGGTRDYVLGVGEVQCSGGHGEVRKDRVMGTMSGLPGGLGRTRAMLVKSH